MIRLYDIERSGNCYKARLMLSLLGLKHEIVPVDTASGAHKAPDFLEMNPLGNLPVIDDNGVIIRDSAAILVYLGSKYGQGKWYPKSPKAIGKVQQWLALSTNEIFHGLAITRAIRLGFRQGDAAALEPIGWKALDALESRLKVDEWLVAGKPSVADIACFPYAAMAPQGGMALDKHLGIRKWIRRIENLEGFTPLPSPPRKS
ncbi:MAG: glutathione S-transferase family protein [Hyphomicrobiaceae bacterium]